MTEAQLQKQVLDYLAAKRILAFRMNTGAMKAEYKGKTRFVRYGAKGMADIIVHNKVQWEPYWSEPYTLYLEIKSPKGKQSPEQKSFQEQVEAAGCRYAVIRKLEDLEEIL